MNYGVEISEYEGKTIGLYGGKFLPFHKGHLNCILKAQSKVDILFVVVGYDEEYDKKLCENSNIQWVSHRVRERWITEELKHFKNIRVLSQYEKRSDDYMNDPSIIESYKELTSKIGAVNFVFGSEPEYAEYYSKYMPLSAYVIIDESRSEVNISATQIRKEGIYKNWELLPKSVQKYYTKRIAICGIESAGKSHLVKMLSNYFNTNFATEYGRDYYDEINGFQDISEPQDYLDIAAGHVHLLNEKAKESNKLLIVDTDLSYTQFFYVLENNKTNDVIDGLIKSNAEKIDCYIFIEPHNFHELDGTRRAVSESERIVRNNLLKLTYLTNNIELNIVDEIDRNKRFEKCIEIIKQQLEENDNE